MRKADLAAAMALLVFSLLLVFVIIPGETTGGVWYGLSPYFYPTVVGIGLFLASAVLAIRSIMPDGKDEAPVPVTLSRFGMFAIVFGIIVLGALVIERFGVWVGGPLLILGVMLFMGERAPTRLLSVSIAPVLVVYLLATYVLRVPLP